MESELETQFAKDQLKEGLQKWPKSISDCQARATSFHKLKEFVTQNTSATQELAALSKEVQHIEPLLRECTEVEKEGYNQVCFRGSPWSGLNAIPFALLLLSFYKSYIVPGVSIFLPFVSWLFPFALLRGFYKIPISFGDYTKILWRMWNGQPLPRTPQDFLNPPPAPPTDVLSQGRVLIQNGWTLMTLGQAIYHPIQQARHFQKLDGDCYALGNSILQIRQIATNLAKTYKSWFPRWFSPWIQQCPDQDARQAFAFCLEKPFWLRHTLRCIGRFEILYRLALRPDTTAAKFCATETPRLILKGFGDPAIPLQNRILSNVVLGVPQYHALITGPNRGGKSSFLRGIRLNVLYAHAFGVVFAQDSTLSFYTWIADGLNLHDEPGQTSMFEREVQFASGVLEKTQGFGLVLYDELFHSTNPPDATRSSQIFCEKLWQKTNCISLLSTHIYCLAEEAPSNLVKPLCLASWIHNGKYRFSYKVQKGICKVSSVDLLLRQFHLLDTESALQ